MYEQFGDYVVNALIGAGITPEDLRMIEVVRRGDMEARADGRNTITVFGAAEYYSVIVDMLQATGMTYAEARGIGMFLGQMRDLIERVHKGTHSGVPTMIMSFSRCTREERERSLEFQCDGYARAVIELLYERNDAFRTMINELAKFAPPARVGMRFLVKLLTEMSIRPLFLELRVILMNRNTIRKFYRKCPTDVLQTIPDNVRFEMSAITNYDMWPTSAFYKKASFYMRAAERKTQA